MPFTDGGNREYEVGDGMVKMKKRYAAVLMSLSSLPSPFGIGGFGEETKRFLSRLKEMGFSAWQVLPFNLPDFGNSPYGSCSAFAGSYLYIDPRGLRAEGYITEQELRECVYPGSPYTVDYDFVLRQKKKVLRQAFSRALPSILPELEAFLSKNSWVQDYALFMTLKNRFDGAAWQLWPEEYRDYRRAVAFSEESRDEMLFYVFEQYIFDTQYAAVRRYAESLGIAVIGDIPIYVAADSVDVWKNPSLFQLNGEYQPDRVAGVPPDAFSADGQLWGNPVYRWEEHQKTGYAWWLSRLDRTLALYGAVRIDHFRAFASYYAVDADADNAKHGVWEKGPGMDLFDPVLKRFDRDRIIAEDLGTCGEDVTALLCDSGIRGMRVVQFGFSGGDSTHLPHHYGENCVAYIGTHDNNTLLGWLWEMEDAQRKFALDYCGFTGSDWGAGGYHSASCRAVIETVWKSAAAGAVIPFQDLCGFGCDARMNIPGVPKDNWRFRTTEETIDGIDREYFRYINALYFR